MHLNATCGNDTSICSPPATSSSSVGLAVGLPVFFVLLIIVVAVILYKYQIWKPYETLTMLQSMARRSTKTEDPVQSAEAAPEHYTSLSREQPVEQAPIYENTGYSANRSRSPPEPEENLYLQCESADDAIYGNDPACSLSIMTPDEDVYVVPDA